jgi:hypothetical protein
VLRRLNRREYDNTVRELLMITDGFRPADEFPQEDTGYGFDNIGSVLTLSPMLMEKYLRAAGKVREVVMRPRNAERVNMALGASKFERMGKGLEMDENKGVLWFNDAAEARTSFYAPADGLYEFEFMLSETPAGPGHAKVGFRLDGQSVGEAEVTQPYKGKDQKAWQKVRLVVPVKQGTRKLSVAFLNDFYDAVAPKEQQDRNLALDEVNVRGPDGLVAPRAGKFLEWLAPGVGIGLPMMEISGEDFRSGEGPSSHDTGTMLLASAGYIRHPLTIAEAGRYKFTLKLGALQAGDEKAKYEVLLGTQSLKKGEVTQKDQAPEWFNWESDLPAGKHELRVAFLNDFYDAKTQADRNLWVHEVRIEGPVGKTKQLEPAKLPELVQRMGERLFRRPITTEEQAQWANLAAEAVKLGDSPLNALGMVASPAFLFHNSPQRAGSPLGDTELVDEITLANRLSYFLWSGPPNDNLMGMAKVNGLRKNLPQAVKLMIQDTKARAMSENFAGQWLQLRDLDGVYRNRRQFPDFEGVQRSMAAETMMFFDHILKQNCSVMDFLDADYTFVNKRLADHYELKDKKGLSTREFKKV